MYLIWEETNQMSEIKEIRILLAFNISDYMHDKSGFWNQSDTKKSKENKKYKYRKFGL